MIVGGVRMITFLRHRSHQNNFPGWRKDTERGQHPVESSLEELVKNKELKILAFSVGVLAIQPSAWIRGKLDLQK